MGRYYHFGSDPYTGENVKVFSTDTAVVSKNNDDALLCALRRIDGLERRVQKLEETKKED